MLSEFGWKGPFGQSSSISSLFNFSLNVFLKFTVFSDQNICPYRTRIRTYHLLCQRPGCYNSTSKTHVNDRIFQMPPIHASVIYQNRLISWISIPFRENSIAHKILHQSVRPIFFRKLLSKLNNSNESFTHFLKTLFFEAWICNFEPSSVITDWHVSKELVGFTGTRCSGSRRSMLCLRCVQTLRAKTLQSDVCHPRCGDSAVSSIRVLQNWFPNFVHSKAPATIKPNYQSGIVCMYMKLIGWIKMELKQVSPASTNVPALSYELIFIIHHFEVLYPMEEPIVMQGADNRTR